ncbi:MAG: TonB-dependent receptor, partial [Gammaproteobacteria bacterium]
MNKHQGQASGLRLNPVAAGCALFVLALSCSTGASAQVQNGPEANAPITVVRVTGIRRGIEDAISVKKESTSIVEAISAEDIGKLPDVSIAESISRLPGLAAQRVGGRAQVISVRGLSPDFSTTTLNGREQVSTGDNRSVEFDQYPSELLSGVTVYKTPDAGLVGQGLSGTLDLQTVRPLNFGARTVAMNARMERNSLGKQGDTKPSGNRFSLSYIDQFLNHTVGVAIGFAHLDSPVLNRETGMYEPWKNVGRPGLAEGTVNTGGTHAGVRTGYNKRDGLMGVLQYRPNRQFNTTLDVYASRFRHEDTHNMWEVNLDNYNGGLTPGLQYTGATYDNGTFASGTAQNVYPLVRGHYDKRKDDIRAAGWNAEWRMKGVKLVGDLSYSKATRNELDVETNTQHGASASAEYLDNVNLQINAGAFPRIGAGKNYSDPSQLYLTNTVYGAGYGKVPLVHDELKSGKLVATFDAPAAVEGWLSSFDVGYNHSDRSKDKQQPEASLSLRGAPAPMPAGLINGSVDLGFAGLSTIPTWDAAALISQYMYFTPDNKANYLVVKEWTVNEKIDTAFVKANIEKELGFATLRGNVGVQVQHTKQSSDSQYWDNSAPAGQQVKPVHDGKTYTDYLPSLNLALAFDNEQTVRLAMAKQIARPRVDQLRSSLEFNVDTSTRLPSGSGGNSQLDPWKAKAFDLSWEKYFQKKAYVAA